MPLSGLSAPQRATAAARPPAPDPAEPLGRSAGVFCRTGPGAQSATAFSSTRILKPMNKVLRFSDLIAEGKLSGQRVFIRADLNVPQDDQGNITEDTRIR